VKLDQAAGANALAGPGGTGDSAADPPGSDAAGWAVPAAIRASVGQQPSEYAPDSEVDGAVLAGWVEARKFSTTRLRPGYDEEEVDAFAIVMSPSGAGTARRLVGRSAAGLAGHYHLGVARPVPENALGRTVREQRPHFPGEVVKTITKQVRRRG